jgi:hypothetical protein
VLVPQPKCQAVHWPELALAPSALFDCELLQDCSECVKDVGGWMMKWQRLGGWVDVKRNQSQINLKAISLGAVLAVCGRQSGRARP